MKINKGNRNLSRKRNCKKYLRFRNTAYRNSFSFSFSTSRCAANQFSLSENFFTFYIPPFRTKARYLSAVLRNRNRSNRCNFFP